MRLRAYILPLVLLYPLYSGVMYSKQQSILFPAASDKRQALAAALPEDAQLVEMPASFGSVRAVYQPAAASAGRGPTILYTHGNFERIEDSFALVQPLRRAGISVLQLEYPGFGGADGEPTYAQINEAAALAYDWLAGRAEIDPQRIIAMGYSIGGAAAGELTRRRQPRALILLSTFTSLEDIAHRYLLPGFLLHYPYDTLARVREFTGSVFVEHGRGDKVIPFGMGERLAATSKHAEFAALDCGHDDCHFDRSLFAERIPAWLAAQGLLDRPSPVLEEHLDARNAE